IPYLFGALGSLTGGFLAGRLIARGVPVGRARKSVIIAAARLMPVGILIAAAQTPWAALLLISVVLFGFHMGIRTPQPLPSDLFDPHAVGSVAGLRGTGGALGSIVFTLTTGWVVQHASSTPVLVTVGLLGPLGTILLFLLAGPIQRVQLDPE